MLGKAFHHGMDRDILAVTRRSDATYVNARIEEDYRFMAQDDEKIDLRPTEQERGPLMAAASVSATLAVVGLGLALATRAVYDHVMTSHSMQSLVAICAGMAVAVVADAALRLMRSKWIEAVGESYDARVSYNLFRRLMRTRMAAMPRAAQAASMFREFEQVRDLHSTAVATALVDAVSAALFLGVLASMTGPLALVTVAGMGTLAGAWYLQRRVEAMSSKSAPTLAAKQGLLHEAALGTEDIKLARAEDRFAAEMAALTEISAQDGAALRSISSLVGTMVSTTASVVQSATLGMGTMLVIQGDITMGTLIAASILSGRAMAPCTALAAAAMKVGRARSAAVTVHHLADGEKEDRHGGADITTCRGEIRLEGVRFHYPGREQPALDGLDLVVAPGEVIALIGPRGCGKSTLGRLLSGLAELDPERDSGAILLDGIPVSQYSRHSLRGHIGAVPQDATLFSRSIKDNIALARLDASDDQILAASRVACADDWILRLPRGFATPVVEQGRTMSGGERQSIGLARVILADPRVVFFDEPTAHFDPAATRRFVENLRAWLPGRTAIIATHRPEILQVVSRVAMMEKGRVVAVKTPAEVLSSFMGQTARPAPPPQTPPPQTPPSTAPAGSGQITFTTPGEKA